MAQLPQMFNAMEFDPAGMSQQLPASDSKGHLVVITESEFKQAQGNANNGYLDLLLEVIEGEAKGSAGHYRINLFNDNEKTVEIAKKQLSALCYVTNQFQVADSQQLHNIPFRAVVGTQKRPATWKEGDPEYTEVKGVLYSTGDAPKKGQTSPQSAAPATAPAPQQQQPVQPAAQPQAAAPWGQQPAAPVQEAAPAAQPWAQAPAAANPPWAK